MFEVADVNITAQHITSGAAQTTAFVVGLRGSSKPVRRDAAAGQQFLSVASNSGEDAALLGSALALIVINRGAALYESAVGRPLYPLRLQLMNFTADEDGHAPLAVYDVSPGIIFLNRRQLDGLLHAPAHMTAVVERFAATIFEQLTGGRGGSVAQVAASFGKLGAVAVAVTFASSVPLWFCIACPIVLGLLAPLLFNGALGQAAELLCSHYQLPQDECSELWYGAFAVAAVLSFASAIPIVYVCRIPECAKQ
ncbi:hypothetical protein WJX73_002341 [Symbiochloris irregularis]|uniref:Uncharacterized protein n=1 Tax=Symbiochloris irregularis TaxID=706552 RepID=A0AAW1NQ35_9CHLO